MKQTELQDFFGGSPLTLVPKDTTTLADVLLNSKPTSVPLGVFNPNLLPYPGPNLLPYPGPTHIYTEYGPWCTPNLSIPNPGIPNLSKPEATPTKHDSGKADWSLMPFEAVEEINKVLEFGANKYAAHNWQLCSGFKYTRVISSLLRHVFAFMRGEDNDPESGISHIAHAGCNIIFLLYYIKNKKRYSNDDRYVSK